MKKMLFAVVLLAGCGTLNEKYVKQDRANYETLAPRIRAMLQETKLYDKDQKADIEDRLNSWDVWTTEGLESVTKDD